MKKQEIPDDVEMLVTYKWDFKLQNYVLVKQEPIKKDDGASDGISKQTFDKKEEGNECT